LVSSVRAHPDYISYFNELAGSRPQEIFGGGDLDGGHDLLRLAEVLRSRHVDKVTLCYFGTADPSRHGLPPFTNLVPFTPTTGWIAISVFELEQDWPGPVGAYSWLKAYQPVALVGRSIQLYQIPGTPSDTFGNTQPVTVIPH
jgi:hypothetical protein